MSAVANLRQVLQRASHSAQSRLDSDRPLPRALRGLLRRALVKPREAEPPPRHYIPPDLGVEELFARLRRLGTEYVVLRWFDRLPHVPKGDDIDLLVSDEGFAVLAGLLRRSGGDGLVACDVYAESGPVGARYQGMPYYPPHLSRRVLSRSVETGLVRVPCTEDHFLSLAYHALYQKGSASGLPSVTPGIVPSASPKHDYAGVLARLAAELSLAVPITMEALDEELARRGWRPSPDMLQRLGEANRWIRRRFATG